MSNPKGMAVAVAKAQEIFAQGGGVQNCPYKSQGWRTSFVKELERLQQQPLMFDSAPTNSIACVTRFVDLRQLSYKPDPQVSRGEHVR